MRAKQVKARARGTPPDRALLLRAVKWAHLPGHGHTVVEACARFGISASAYRRARQELGREAIPSSDDDIVLAGLHPAGPVPIENLIYYYDWTNHAGMSPAEMLVILERLIAKGTVRRTGERFELTREWP